jgi:hypothetical protein
LGTKQSHSDTSHQRSHFKNPRGTISSEGSIFTILLQSSAPDDLVKLVPRRANVGTKANTSPSLELPTPAYSRPKTMKALKVEPHKRSAQCRRPPRRLRRYLRPGKPEQRPLKTLELRQSRPRRPYVPIFCIVKRAHV